MFGPEYHKINSLWKRDGKGVVIPGQYAQPEFEYLEAAQWRWTEKVDGTNIRIHWDGAKVVIGGRTDNAQIPTFLVAALEPYTDPDVWRVVFQGSDDVTLYGEGYGAKIQKGSGNYRPDQGFILFDIRIGNWWMTDETVAEIAGKFGMDVVPSYGEFSPIIAWSVIKEGGLKSKWPNVQIEGLVGRPLVDLFARNGDRIITKVKVRDWADYQRAQGAAA